MSDNSPPPRTHCKRFESRLVLSVGPARLGAEFWRPLAEPPAFQRRTPPGGLPEAISDSVPIRFALQLHSLVCRSVIWHLNANDRRLQGGGFSSFFRPPHRPSPRQSRPARKLTLGPHRPACLIWQKAPVLKSLDTAGTVLRNVGPGPSSRRVSAELAESGSVRQRERTNERC